MGGHGNSISREAERFFAMVLNVGECWNWTGALDKDGYGRFGKNKVLRYYSAHRWSWEYHNRVGPVPAGFELDHTCENRKCVNPKHLEVVTHAENMRRRKYRGPSFDGNA